jgi:hypothetical protein
MGVPSIKVDFGDLLPYLAQQFLEFIGKDEETLDTAAWFADLQKIAIVQASEVKCFGMHRPLPLSQIYQRVRLKVGHHGCAFRFSMADGLLKANISHYDLDLIRSLLCNTPTACATTHSSN